MADEVIISWNFANWITVALMVGVLFVLVATYHRIMQQKKAQAS